MYPVFRRLDVLFAMQDYPAAGLGTLYHVALKKEAVRQVIIRQDDAFVVVPIKMLIQKLSQLVPQDRIPHYGLEILPSFGRFCSGMDSSRHRVPSATSSSPAAYERNGSYGSLTRSV